MRSAKCKGVLRRNSGGLIDLHGRAAPGAAGLAEHAQVQRDRAGKKEYRNEVLLQSSPHIDENRTSETMPQLYQAAE